MWIELHQSLPTHRKTLRLEGLLGLRQAQAVGHLCLLWLWALDNAPDGNLSLVSEKELALIAGYNPRRAADFVEALVQSGFLEREDGALHIHGWDEYGGKVLEAREKSRERKRRSREKEKAEAVTVASASCPRDVTFQYNKTEENKKINNMTENHSTEEDPTVPCFRTGRCRRASLTRCCPCRPCPTCATPPASLWTWRRSAANTTGSPPCTASRREARGRTDEGGFMDDIEQIAALAGQMLGQEINEAQPDLRRLRELSGLVKDLNALRRDAAAGEPQTLTVRFADDIAACAV